LTQRHKFGAHLLSEKYLAWNQAIAETIYNEGAAGTPVYLDLDDDAFEKIAAHYSLSNLDNTKAGLAASVQESLNWNGSTSEMLWPVVGASRVWMRQFLRGQRPAGAPPMIAFLAVAVLAAEAMGGGSESPNAYYAHLHKILNVTSGSAVASKFENSYREYVLVLWGYLKKWLTELEWALGMPTAEALSHPYVSVAVSQALVREGDRKKLSRMFDFLNLNPGESISPAEMSDLFNVWIAREDSQLSASIKALWKKSSARERLSEVISQELESWDGTVHGLNGQGGKTGIGALSLPGKLKLALKVSSFMGSSRLTHTLAVGASGITSELGSSFRAKSTPDVELPFLQATKAYAILQNPSLAPIESLLVGDIELQSPALVRPARRIPKDVVVLGFDEDLQMFLEVERAGLGQDMMILVRDQPQLIEGVKTILQDNARPGFVRMPDSTVGVPPGWVAYTDVQLISSVESTFSTRVFSALMPLASSQLVLTGGLKIPGPMSNKKFLATRAPELRAVSQGSVRVRVELIEIVWGEEDFNEIPIASWSSENGTIFVNLATVLHKSGDFKVVFFEGTMPTIQRDFYLRSGEKPDPLAARSIPKLAHCFEIQGALAAFQAVSVEDDDANIIRGAYSNYTYEQNEEKASFAKSFADWDLEPEIDVAVQSSKVIVVPEVGSDSCIYTGKHTRELPMCQGGAKYVIGVCRTCGDTKPEFCDAYRAKKKENYEKLSAARVRNNVAPVMKEVPNSLDFEEVMSLILHVVTGPASQIINALETLGGSQMTGTQLLELLDQMGHVEIVRNPSGQPLLWALVFKQVTLREGLAENALLGSWQRRDVLDLSHLVLSIEEAPLPRFGIEFSVENETGTLEDSLVSAGFEVGSSESVAAALPEFSWVRNALDRTPLPNLDNIDKFDLKTGKWTPAEFLSEGAVRLGGKYGARYFFVSQDDIVSGTGASASATTVKYLAANAAGVPLIKYSKIHNSLFVPLGARLPGLYGRVALLASGTPPIDVVISVGKRSVKVTQYKNVPLAVAENIARLLAD